jgi:GT2 family glycosyltransferase
VSPSDVAIVVPVGGSSPEWSRAAASLARLDPRPGEIVVVLDGAGTGSAAACARAAGATVIALDARGGPARARNQGARATTRDLLLFLDADVEVPPDLVSRVAASLADPQITAVFGSYDDAPGAPGVVSQYRNLLHHFVHQRSSVRASTFWAGCGAVGRRAFLEAGGFDERYRSPSIEDIELGTRLAAGGHAIRLEKTLQVKHLKRWTLRQVLSTDLLARAVPWTELMLRQGRLVNDLNVTTKDRASVALALAPLAALPLAPAVPALLVVALGCVAGAMALNAPLFRFFRERRGLAFAGAAVPLYWLYLATCGMGFALGAARHWRRAGRRSVARPRHHADA